MTIRNSAAYSTQMCSRAIIDSERSDTMNTKRKPLAINTVIVDKDDKRQRYTVRSVLGYGGTGITYNCLSSDNRYYCLKEVYPTELIDCLTREHNGKIILNPIFGAKHQATWNWYIDHLRKEEETQRTTSVDLEAEANDPYFLKSYGTFTADNGNLYAKYDMENGCVLSQLIDGLSPAELLSVLITACKKLDCLHTNKNHLHLDLSPSNLYVINHASGKEAYFLDFGSALPLDNLDDTNHRFSSTEGYSAQEVVAKAQGNQSSIYKIGKYSDTYSLVAVLFRALVGDCFSADYRLEPHLWMSKVRMKLDECGAERATDQIIEILRKGLSEKESRFQSATELFNALCAAHNTITGNNAEINELIKDIEARIANFEKTVLQKIDAEGKKTRVYTEKENEKTRNHVSKIAIRFAACFIAIIGMLIGLFVFLNLTDFEAPKITIQACPVSNQGCEIYGDYFTCELRITDNKELDWHYITEKDLIFDGFECVPKLIHLNNGIYQLTLSNIKRMTETAQIVIREGRAKDASGNTLGETHIPLVFVNKTGDVTSPSVLIFKPSSALNQHLISVGENLTYLVSLSDETELAKENVTEEYIHAVDFQYDRIDIGSEYGLHKITFINIRGGNGEHRVYFSPGLAIDSNKNYTKGVEVKFYLYDDEKNIDISNPKVEISNPTILPGVIEYQLNVTDNMSIRSFDLSKKDITLIGFSANIEIEYVPTSSNQRIVRTIRFTNIKNTSDSNDMFFIVNSGIAIDSFNNQTNAEISQSFTIPNQPLE